MKWLLIFLILIVFILTVRLSFSVVFSYNLFDNSGEVVLKIFKVVTVFKAKIAFTYYYISLYITPKKVIKIKLDLNDENLQFINDLQGMLLAKMYLINLNSCVQFGLKNAFNTATAYGGISLLNRFLFMKILQHNSDAAISMNVSHKFAENIFIIYLDAKFIVSFFDIVWAFFSATLNRRVMTSEQTK